MNRFTVDPSHFTLGGAYYPKGHVFAMFTDEPAAHGAAHRVASVSHVGAVNVATAEAIRETFGARAEEVGGIPSVGREDQFMLRFVELARSNEAGLLIEVAHANVPALTQALRDAGARVGYYYRTLIIEELIDASPEAEAAASGKL